MLQKKGLLEQWLVMDIEVHAQVFFSNGRYIDYLSMTYATNKNRILKVPL